MDSRVELGWPLHWILNFWDDFEPNYIPKVQKSVLWVLHYLPDWIPWWDETRVPPCLMPPPLDLEHSFYFPILLVFTLLNGQLTPPPISTLNFFSCLLSVWHSTFSCNKVSISPQNHKNLCFPPLGNRAIHLFPGLNPKDKSPDVISF